MHTMPNRQKARPDVCLMGEAVMISAALVKTDPSRPNDTDAILEAD